jgi:hypothetical protein
MIAPAAVGTKPTSESSAKEAETRSLKNAATATGWEKRTNRGVSAILHGQALLAKSSDGEGGGGGGGAPRPKRAKKAWSTPASEAS